MVAYSFKKRFGPPILAGIKAQTIRGERKRHARLGEKVQLFTGMRTRSCRKLGESTCVAVERVKILFPIGNRPATIAIYSLCGWHIRDLFWRSDLDDFARADGFDDFSDMTEFWANTHPGQDFFSGTIIRWKPLAAADALDIASAA